MNLLMRILSHFISPPEIIICETCRDRGGKPSYFYPGDDICPACRKPGGQTDVGLADMYRRQLPNETAFALQQKPRS